MLGHLKPSLCSLGTANKVAYRTLYCSICASLRDQYSLPYSLFINNELTLVLLSLKPYYKEEITAKETPCPAAAFTQKNPAASHPAIDVAAKLSVLLGWVKVVDWDTDQPRFYKKYLRKILDRKVQQTLPQISEDFQKVIEEYLYLTKTNSNKEEKVRHYSGLLSRHVVLEVGQKTDISENALQELATLFELSGEMIAIADHLIDLEGDMAQRQFNPIVFRSEQEQIKLSTAYYDYLQLFNRLKIYSLEQLNLLLQKGIIATPFKVAMRESFKSISRQIQQKRPGFLIEEIELIGAMQIAHQDCGSAAMEGCNCAVQQGEMAGAYASQCPCGECCNAGGNCCKGCGDCCDGCGKSCGQCSGSCSNCCNGCNNCCGGCNDTCGNCGKSCDSCTGSCSSCCSDCNGSCSGCGSCCEGCESCLNCSEDCLNCCGVDTNSPQYQEPPSTNPEDYLPKDSTGVDSMVVTYQEFYSVLGKIEGKTIADRREWRAVFDSLQTHNPDMLRLAFDQLQQKGEITLEEMRMLMDSLKK